MIKNIWSIKLLIRRFLKSTSAQHAIPQFPYQRDAMYLNQNKDKNTAAAYISLYVSTPTFRPGPSRRTGSFPGDEHGVLKQPNVSLSVRQ